MEIRYPTTPEERPRILVVEPNRNNLGVIARRLGPNGNRIICRHCMAVPQEGNVNDR